MTQAAYVSIQQLSLLLHRLPYLCKVCFLRLVVIRSLELHSVKEVWVSMLTCWDSQGVREVEEWMSQSSGIPLEELRPHMFLLRDRDATSHLMRSAPALCSHNQAAWRETKRCMHPFTVPMRPNKHELWHSSCSDVLPVMRKPILCC